MTEIKMPSLSPTMTSGSIVKWFVKEGDSVLTGDVLAEIETDKATMELESIEEGKVKNILIKEGEKDIPVGTVLAVVDDGNFINKKIETNKHNATVAIKNCFERSLLLNIVKTPLVVFKLVIVLVHT